MNPTKPETDQPADGSDSHVEPLTPAEPKTPGAPADPQGFAGSSVASDLVPPSPTSATPPATSPTGFEPLNPEPAAAEAPKEPESDAPLPPLPPLPVMPSDPLPMTHHKRRKKGLIIGLVVAAVVVILTGGAAASYYYMVNQPENILKQALANSLDLSKTKTVHYSGSIDVENDAMNFGGTYKGALNNETGAFDMSTEIDVLVANLKLDIRSTNGKTFYFRAGGLDSLLKLLTGNNGLFDESDSGLASLYASILAAVNNKWIEVNESLIKQYSGGTISSQPLSQEELDKLAEAYVQNPFVVIKEKLPDATIKGAASYHYKLGVDRAKLKSFVAALKDAQLSMLKITQEQLNVFNKWADGAPIDQYPFEIWISKADKMINQVAFSVTEDATTTKARFTVESYNQPVNVEKPTSSKSIVDLIAEFFQAQNLQSGLPLPTDLGNGISL